MCVYVYSLPVVILFVSVYVVAAKKNVSSPSSPYVQHIYHTIYL